jgi:hypothetical protein
MLNGYSNDAETNAYYQCHDAHIYRMARAIGHLQILRRCVRPTPTTRIAFCGPTSRENSSQQPRGGRAVRIPFQRKLDEAFRSDRSIWLKIGGGVLVALYVTFQSIMRQGKVEDRSIMWRVTLIALLVAVVCGGLISFLLSMKDRMTRRLARGERVNPFARAYLCMGIWSLLLWCPTIFFLGIVLIILTH